MKVSREQKIYYEPKDEKFIIENTYHEYSTLIDESGDIILAPSERREIKRGDIKLYQDYCDEPFIHMGFWNIAVEVDGKRYEHIDVNKTRITECVRA